MHVYAGDVHDHAEPAAGAPARLPGLQHGVQHHQQRQELHTPRQVEFLRNIEDNKKTSVGEPDPDPQDPHVFGPPGTGSISQMYGSCPFLINVLSGLK